MRAVLACAALALASAAAAADADPTALGGSDVQLLDERAWVEAVSRRRQDVANAPAPIEVLLAEDLRQSPAATIPDRLRYLPGVDVYQIRHGQYEVGLRGYNGPINSRILVLQDGWQFAQADLQSPVWTGTIFLSDLERIEIAKGPASVTYGANAFGGVIAMTSRAVPERPRLTAVGDAGWPYSRDGDATLASRIAGPFYGKLSLGFTRLDDLPGTKSGVQYQYSPRNDEDTRRDTEAWRLRAVAGADLGGDWRLESGMRVLHRAPWEVVDGSTLGPPSIAIDDRLGTVELRSDLLRLSLAQQRIDSDYRNLRSVYDPATDFGFLQLGFADLKRTARVQAELGRDAEHLTLGAEASRYRSRSNLWRPGTTYADDATWAEVSYDSLAVFAENQYRLADAWQLTAGMRGDRDSQVGNQISPRLALNWTPDRRQFGLLSWSHGYRLPNLLERYENDFFAKPSEGLRAETINAVEAKWRLRDGHDDELALGGFWNRSNQQIWRLSLPFDEQRDNFLNWALNGAPPNVGPGPFFQFANLDNPYTVWGTEASGRLHLGGTPLTAWGNATWQLGRFRDPVHFSSPGFDTTPLGSPLGVIYRYDYTVPRDANAPPEWKANAGLEWKRGPWFASTAGRYVSGRTVYDIGATSLFHNTFIAMQRLDPYVAMDLGVGYRFPGGDNRFVRLSVMDLFDSGHSEWFRSSQAELVSGNEAQYSSDIGRQITLAAGMEF